MQMWRVFPDGTLMRGEQRLAVTLHSACTLMHSTTKQVAVERLAL